VEEYLKKDYLTKSAIIKFLMVNKGVVIERK